MVPGERGIHMVHALKLVAQDLKPELGLAIVLHHQMVAKLALVPHLLQPLAIISNVQVGESRKYFRALWHIFDKFLSFKSLNFSRW